MQQIAQESGFAKEYIEENGEDASSTSTFGFIWNNYGYNLSDELYIAQRNVICELADKGNCVIVGRCSNYILEQADIDSFDVFIKADIEKRAENVADRVELKGDELIKFLQRRDHKRRVYYRFYTRRKWGDYHDYNMMLDSGMIGKDKCVDMIISAIGE